MQSPMDPGRQANPVWLAVSGRVGRVADAADNPARASRSRFARCLLAIASTALLFSLATGTAGCAPLQAAASWRAAPDFSRLVRENGPAVVNIGVAREAPPARLYADPLRGMAPGQDNVDETSLGSGFILSDDGFILTNAHVVARGTQISVKLTDRREFKARLIGLDTVADVALLKIDATGLPTVKIGDPASVEVGNWALAIGSPFGFSNSVSAGIVSAKGRVLPGAEYMPFLQTDVPVNPGNSGGPLFNLRGEVIGVNSRIYSRSGGYQGLSFAIPIDVAMRIKEQLQHKGAVTRGRIGVAVQEVSQALAASFRLPRPAGALVSYVQPGGAADRAGVKAGDVILQVAGREVEQSADALIFIADLPPGVAVPFRLWRERAPVVLAVAPERFDAPRIAQAAQPGPAPLGMIVRPLLPRERQALRIDGGLLVQRVNAAALRAGVAAGDVILALNGQPVDSVEGLAEEVGAADGAVALLVQRGAARLFIPIEVRALRGEGQEE
ncbi:trypsin-like peptidase domain-containing protein [Cupriavidus basilensis]|uniref:Probable periplasmic serine endoprotease DegP-like n=1 Tax=Cupriavidus basilensis TaxID=68895 RepID=A0ABT6ATJ8_9BURK|nr:trypsin-like peptidase domain-containing protein [Cupriavidus basilensis]MDF3835949.1 trypsin-like peptidase domain-containing protein [Cupriavidus basilensis]